MYGGNQSSAYSLVVVASIISNTTSFILIFEIIFSNKMIRKNKTNEYADIFEQQVWSTTVQGKEETENKDQAVFNHHNKQCGEVSKASVII